MEVLASFTVGKALRLDRVPEQPPNVKGSFFPSQQNCMFQTTPSPIPKENY